MSGIPSNMNVLGSIMQSQVSSNEKAKADQAKENQETYDSRQIARMTEQQTDEVEETEATDDVFVRREDEESRDGGDARDTWERHRSQKIYHEDDSEGDSENGDVSNSSDSMPPESDNGGIIDVSV